MKKYILPIALVMSSVATFTFASDEVTTSEPSKAKSSESTQAAEKSYSTFKKNLIEKLKPLIGETAHIFDIAPLSNGTMFQVYLSDGNSVVVNKEMTIGYIVKGRSKDVTVIDLNKMTNMTEKRRRAQETAFKTMAKPFLTYKAKNEKDSIDVYIDPQCSYCLKLHDEIPELNQMGITVNYYPNFVFDRGGENKSSSIIARAAFCSDEPEKNYDQYSGTLKKIMKESSYDGIAEWANKVLLEKANSCENDLEEQSFVARSMGFSGTPAIVFSDGMRYSSYLKPKLIIEYSISLRNTVK